jgi:hypothetical protein
MGDWRVITKNHVPLTSTSLLFPSVTAVPLRLLKWITG